jgi:hypothetical protein
MLRLEQALLFNDSACHIGKPQIALPRGRLESAEGVVFREVES